MLSTSLTSFFPATFLIIRVNRIALLVPWFLLWALILAMTPACWFLGLAIRVSDPKSNGRWLLFWHLLIPVLAAMRGSAITLRHKHYRLCMKWV